MLYSLSIDGWLYLARPVLALAMVLLTVVLWAVDRAQARQARIAALHAVRPTSGGHAQPQPDQSWWLEVGGTRRPVGDALTIGRAPDCSIVVDDPVASALHAVVAPGVDGVPRLEDLGSTNGTLCRGQLVRAPIALAPGDVIQIGDAVLRVGGPA